MMRHNTLNTLRHLAESLAGNTIHTGATSPELASVINELNSIKSTIRSGFGEIYNIFEDGTHLETFKEKLYKETLQPLAEGVQTLLEEVETVKKLTESEKVEREELEKLFNEFLDLFGDRDANVKEKLEILETDKASVEEVLEKMTSVFESFMEVKDNSEQVHEALFASTTDILEDVSDRVKRLSDIVFRQIINPGDMEEPSATSPGTPAKTEEPEETPEEEKPEEETPEKEEEPAGESLAKTDLLSRLSEIRKEADKLEEALKEMEEIPAASMADLEPPQKDEEEEEAAEEKLESPVGGEAPSAPAAAAVPSAPAEDKVEGKEEEEETEEPKEEEEDEVKEGQSLTESLLDITRKAFVEGADEAKVEREAAEEEPFRESENDETKENEASN